MAQMRIQGVSPDYIIVGIGNPGTRYEKTRKNVGFHVVDYLSSQSMLGSGCRRLQHSALTEKCVLDSNVVYYVKPQTYISNSGMAVKDALEFFNMSSKRLIVIHDDTTLPIGTFKIIKGEDSIEHKGIDSIVEHLGTNDFIRIKVGIGTNPDDIDLNSYVLGIIPDDEYATLCEVFPSIRKAFTYMFYYGLEECMRIFN